MYIDRFIKLDLKNVTDILVIQNINYIKTDNQLLTFGYLEIHSINRLNLSYIKNISLNNDCLDDILLYRNNSLSEYLLIRE